MIQRAYHGVTFGLVALALAAAAVSSTAMGCGSDPVKSMDAGPAGEPCLSPGLTSNDCVCSNHVMGSRTCADAGVWGACSCANPLPDGQVCFEGQRLICRACPGEKEGRITRCLAGGVFDCGCDRDAGSIKDGGAAGSGAAKDAGHDAAGSGDAG